MDRVGATIRKRLSRAKATRSDPISCRWMSRRSVSFWHFLKAALDPFATTVVFTHPAAG